MPAGAPYGADVFPGNGTRQSGYTVGLNTETGEFAQIARMGRLNHENTVVVPGGWNGFTVLTTDDASAAPSSELYMFRGDTEQDVHDGDGTFYAFRVTRVNGVALTNPADAFNGANDYLEPGDRRRFQRRVHCRSRRDRRRDDAALPQTALENSSNDNNVMQFIRLEDLAYDKNDARVVYIADTGASGVAPNPATGRLHRPGGVGQAPNGRIFEFVFNADNPLVVDSLTVLADGDAPGTEVFVPFTSPDNIDTSRKSLMVQEDTGNALVWQYRLQQSDWSGGGLGQRSWRGVQRHRGRLPVLWAGQLVARRPGALDRHRLRYHVGARHPDQTGRRAAHAARAAGLLTTNPRHGMPLAGIPEPPKTFGRPT